MSTRQKRNARNDRVELMQGTLDMLILRTLRLGPTHGQAIAKTIERNSDDVLQVEQGSLYPALHRLEEQGLVAAEWGPSENNRRAKYYRLTRTGRRRLEVEVSNWEKLAAAVGRVIETA